MTAKQIAEKRYAVKLSDKERERLNTLIRTGKHPARQLTKARILLKADASEAGEGWRDCDIAVALDTSVDTVARTRQQLVEEGFDAVLVRKYSPASARPRIFDGAAEAKRIALACSEPPKGRKRWTLQLLEEQVVELKIVDRASDNTIGRIRGRDGHCWPPPAQIRTSPIRASGSYLGCVTANRVLARLWRHRSSWTGRAGVVLDPGALASLTIPSGQAKVPQRGLVSNQIRKLIVSRLQTSNSQSRNRHSRHVIALR